ncbi:MAG: sulfite exporter TauE/SafE family protein [Phycisphaerae bacterium]|jgi:sulfite exporter TauE/SafE|nr:sulfite exporter TauE/SafE family protein [Phycisphaerae bacterium]
MSPEMISLLAGTAVVGFVHTLAGPDHYLPFIAMAKARRWSTARTAWVTFACGIGHIAGSVVLGLIGIAAGWTLDGMKLKESVRGEYAAWLLMAFGLAYCVWGIRRAIRNKPHTHHHAHVGIEHTHHHAHNVDHAHPHNERKRNITPWILFTIFVFGPCELLIPFLLWPAAAGSVASVIMVASVFALVTISTMLAVVMLATYGLNLLPARSMQRYSHALAGGVIFLCGVAIIHMGL